MHFTFSQPALGCLELFGVQLIAKKVNLLLATSFVYLFLVGTAKTALPALELAANLYHFGTKYSVVMQPAKCKIP